MTINSLPKGIILFVFVFLFNTPIYSQIFVDTDAAAGGDGASWATAYRNLQTALGTATSGDELWVAEGIYQIVGSADVSFEVPSGVAIYGGFDATETARSQRDWQNNITSLDGNNFTQTIIYFEDVSSSTVLDGFTIENGFANGINSRTRSGAAIYIDVASGPESSPQIINCIIKNNTSNNGGGAMYIDGSFSSSCSPYFENCTFDNNYSFADGGAIYTNGTNSGSATATYIKCTFKSNHSVGSGGGLFNHGGGGNATTVFKSCNFENNVAEGNGGAMYSLGTSSGQANHTIINSRFYANTGFAAGGIYNNGGNGGDASPTITNCTFYLNEATGSGGTGGAIYNNGDNAGQSNTIIKNCIIWGNIAPYGTHALKNVNCSPTISYCLTDTDDCSGLNNGTGSNITCGSGMIYNEDPLFNDAGNGNLELTSTSPAKNVGEDSANNEAEDLNENTRKIGTIDMGAYEFDAALPVELEFFTANLENGRVNLEWATLSETGNSHFEVERSNDGKKFFEIESVEGAGTYNDYNIYKSFDFEPKQGKNYYRLKIVSLDGGKEYSNIAIVKLNSTEFNVFPNPTDGRLNIAFKESVNVNKSLAKIYSVYGQLIYSAELLIDGSQASINLDAIRNMLPGHYIISIELSGNEVVHQRFQKVK